MSAQFGCVAFLQIAPQWGSESQRFPLPVTAWTAPYFVGWQGMVASWAGVMVWNSECPRYSKTSYERAGWTDLKDPSRWIVWVQDFFWGSIFEELFTGELKVSPTALWLSFLSFLAIVIHAYIGYNANDRHYLYLINRLTMFLFFEKDWFRGMKFKWMWWIPKSRKKWMASRRALIDAIDCYQ
jgi:hypothetical protein